MPVLNAEICLFILYYYLGVLQLLKSLTLSHATEKERSRHLFSHKNFPFLAYRNGNPKNLMEGKGRSNLNLALYGGNFERQRKAAGRATRSPVDNLEDGDKEGERCQVLGIFHDLRRALDYICGEPHGVIMYCENRELIWQLPG